MRDRTAPPKPSRAPETGDRSARLAIALRANLARRKAQQKARRANEQTDKKQE